MHLKLPNVVCNIYVTLFDDNRKKNNKKIITKLTIQMACHCEKQKESDNKNSNITVNSYPAVMLE